jgi:dihydrofolate reductase
MTRLTVTTFVSLDGVMQGPGGPAEDPSGGFTLGGWVVPFFDEDTGRAMSAIFERPAAFLLGRRTWEIFASHWPRVTDPTDLVATKLNTLPKYVASRTLKTVPWQNSTLLGSDLPRAVAALKERYEGRGELQVHGSCGLVQSLLEHDLVDEYTLLTFPVVLGAGRRLFGPGARPAPMTLVDSTRTSTGVVISTYRRAGVFKAGTVAPPS